MKSAPGDSTTTSLNWAEIEALIQDLLSSTEHCPARDVIAAGLISNMRDEIAGLKPIPKARFTTALTDRMEEALHRIASWADAYPLSVFPEPDATYYAKARDVLEANGMTLDRLSAAAMRHVITQVGHIAKMAISDA